MENCAGRAIRTHFMRPLIPASVYNPSALLTNTLQGFKGFLSRVFGAMVL